MDRTETNQEKTQARVRAERPCPEALSPAQVWDRIDPLAPDLDADPARDGLAGLPYALLKGPGFERLCYELLVAEGENPRLFGRSGQGDLEVDIICESGGLRSCYQCKNLTDAPRWTQIRESVDKFEADWLNHTGLPAPETWFYCCPHPLDDNKLGAAWTTFKDAFKARTGVDILFWDRHWLDASLRGLPDIVSGLFSPGYAEHFCPNAPDWQRDPWVRVQTGKPRHLGVRRFLERHARGAVQVDAELATRFTEGLSQSPVLVIRGLPGSGKTVTALGLAAGLSEPRRRIYYTTLKDQPDRDALWRSVARRASLPSLFLLDDAHLDLRLAGDLIDRLGPELEHPRRSVRLLILLRDIPDQDSDLTDTPDWLNRFDEDGQVIDLRTDLARTRALVHHLRPDLAGLSPARLKRLHHGTGGDLLLLDQALADLKTPAEIDGFNPARLYRPVREQYFGGNRRLPTIQRLAALAQFDLAPLADWLETKWQPGERDLAASLMAELFGPHRLQFLHASLAELVLRSLLELEDGPERVDQLVGEITARELIGYLHYLMDRAGNGQTGAESMAETLSLVLRSRLKLAGTDREAGIKALVLADPRSIAAIEKALPGLPFGFLRVCLTILDRVQAEAKAQYVALVERRFATLFNADAAEPDIVGLRTIGTGLWALRLYDPAVLDRIGRTYGADRFLQLIATSGTLYELFMVMQCSTLELAEGLLDGLDPSRAATLIEKTITTGRSIGTLHMAMRELGQRTTNILARLEQAIGVAGFLRLIAANGTLFELFMMLRYATPELAEGLLDGFDQSQAAALIEKTIDSRRSIGTLNLAMRELGQRDTNILARLEQAIGADGFLRLIAANGTLVELFRALQRGSPELAEGLLDRLDHSRVAALIEKTIATGRSIGTLGMVMRELGQRDTNILARLEQAIGATGFLRLIAANGTLFELFMMLRYATPELAEGLLDGFDQSQAAALIEKTIASGRSIGTLSLAMRELGRRDTKVLARLEQAIGTTGFLRLIAANGTLVELFRALQHATSEFSQGLLDGLNENTVETLVDRNATGGGSIESFHYALKHLAVLDGKPKAPGKGDRRGRLEHLIGIASWWRIIGSNGTLNSLTEIHNAMSPGFATEVTLASTGLGRGDWSRIIRSGQFRNACTFLNGEIERYPSETRDAINEVLIAEADALANESDWFDLNTSPIQDLPKNPPGQALMRGYQRHIEATTVAHLEGLDFRETVNGIGLLWKERPDLRDELASRLPQLLPPERAWPREKGEVSAIRILLIHGVTRQLSEETLVWLIETLRRVLDRSTCEGTHTLPLFLLVWNLAAAWFERGPSRSFSDTLPSANLHTLTTMLAARVPGRKSDDEKLALLMLAGLLAFLDPGRTPTLRTTLEPLSNAKRWLQPLAEQATFIPGYFALHGLALLSSPAAVLTTQVRNALRAKAADYTDSGPAIAHLCATLDSALYRR